MGAKLFFRYSTVNSGKTIDLLKIAHNYEQQGKRVLLGTSEKDCRNGEILPDAQKGEIYTRLGLIREGWLVERVDLLDMAKKENPDCVLLDEAQFYPREKVILLTRIVDELDISVIAYGLKSDFQGNLFEGSNAFLVYADKSEEIKTVCQFCNKKATFNLRTENDIPTFKGSQIGIDSLNTEVQREKEIKHIPLCRKCYMLCKISSTPSDLNIEEWLYS